MISLTKAIKNRIKKNESLFFAVKELWNVWLNLCSKFTTDERFVEKQYYNRTGKKLDLINPRLYNEKVQYTKLYYRDERLKKMVDKFEVREYVANTIGEQYLTHIYGVYDSVNEINFDELPERFVLKLTNGSGYNFICKNKTEKNIKLIKKRFRHWIKIKHHLLGREWAYKDVPNRIICEEYLETDEEAGLKDYKVFCFSGVPKLIQVDWDRFTNHKRNLYTPEWDFIDEKVAYENDKSTNIKKPSNLEEMLECACKLSKGFPHVRVDFYSFDDRLIFGEMTFYHGSGYLKFYNPDFETQMGDWWELSK